MRSPVELPPRDATNGFSLGAPPALLSPSHESDSAGINYAHLRTERKIADLEITNKSLLAINSGLEVTKYRQARELRDLKRKMREGRAVSASLPTEAGLAGPRSVSTQDDDEDEENDDYASEIAGDESGEKEDPELEASHSRCKAMIDAMLGQARKAILYQYVHDDTKRGIVNIGDMSVASIQSEDRAATPVTLDAERVEQGQSQSFNDDSTLGDVTDGELSASVATHAWPAATEEASLARTTTDETAEAVAVPVSPRSSVSRHVHLASDDKQSTSVHTPVDRSMGLPMSLGTAQVGGTAPAADGGREDIGTAGSDGSDEGDSGDEQSDCEDDSDSSDRNDDEDDDDDDSSDSSEPSTSFSLASNPLHPTSLPTSSTAALLAATHTPSGPYINYAADVSVD